MIINHTEHDTDNSQTFTVTYDPREEHFEEEDWQKLLLRKKDQDTGNRQIWIKSGIDPACAEQVIKILLQYENAAPGVPIHLFIFSPGGCVSSGLSIIDVMEHISSPVFTYAIGYAASMGAVILAAGEDQHRYILPHSRVMIHQTMSSMEGTLDNVRSKVQLQAAMEDELKRILARKTGQSIETIHQETRFDKWLNAEEAKAFGLVDFILPYHEAKLVARHS